MKYFKVFNKYEKINKKYGKHWFENTKFSRQNSLFDIFHSFNIAKMNCCKYSIKNVNKAKNNGLFDNNDFECKYYFNHINDKKIEFVIISKHKNFELVKVLDNKEIGFLF